MWLLLGFVGGCVAGWYARKLVTTERDWWEYLAESDDAPERK